MNAERLANTPLDAIACDGTTEAAPYDNATTANTLTSGRDADRQHRTVVVIPISTHSQKVCRSTQTILPFQRSARSQY